MKKIYAFYLAILGFTGFSDAQTVIPTTDELILPQYAYYGGTDATSRIPFVCRLKITGLNPSSTYRYFTGMSSNGSATTQTPGNMYRINNGNSANGYGYITGFTVTKAINSSEINNDIMNTTNTSFHGRFNTDASGSYTGWFACVPVNASVSSVPVQAAGSDVYFYVQVNDGGTGTALAKSYRTASTVRLLDYSSGGSGCTALLGTSDVGGEKMVTIYDNEAGTGRPLYCTFTESNNCASGCTPAGVLNEGTIWTNPVLYPTVDGVSGSWAAIIPNTLSGGVKAINFLNIPDASPVTLSNAPVTNTSADGTWNGVATANPTGGATSPITINSIAGTILPVKLLSFDGKTAKDGIQLVWTTTQETKNKHFEIMRAGTDGKFSSIGKVNAANPSALTNRYEFLDSRPLSGKNSYRLKQVDEDGTSTLTKVITIDNQKGQSKMRIASQSPNELVVAISSSIAASGHLVYSDAAGRILYSKQVVLSTGENSLSIPVAQSALQMGVITFTPEKGDRMQLKLIR
jgi:hypothetical protein